MTKPIPYNRHIHWALKNFRAVAYPLLLLGILSCSHEKYKWSTKEKNTTTSLTGSDSLIRVVGISKSSSYGYSNTNPVKLGVQDLSLGATYPEKYLSTLTGPQGEPVVFTRIKSCCPFKTANSTESFKDLAVLEVYAVYFKGMDSPVTLYINFFDEGQVLAPKGFSFKTITTK